MSINQNRGGNDAIPLGKNVESEDVRIIGEKLEHMLVKQQKELDELKRKHELDIENLLKELPLEICWRVLNVYHSKVSDDRMDSELFRFSGHCTDSDAS